MNKIIVPNRTDPLTTGNMTTHRWMKFFEELISRLEELDDNGGTVDPGEVDQLIVESYAALIADNAKDISHIQKEIDLCCFKNLILDQVGKRNRWQGFYETGRWYSQNDEVGIPEGIAIANKNTAESPFIQETGQAEWFLEPFPTFVTTTELQVVESGYRFEITEKVRLSDIGFSSLSTSYNYKILIKYNGAVQLLYPSDLADNDFNYVDLTTILYPDTILEIVLLTSNYFTTTPVTGTWYKEPIPTSEGFSINDADNRIYISKTDSTSTDRTAELLSITPDTTITLSQTTNNYQYLVISAPTDMTDYVTFDVIPINKSGMLNDTVITDIDIQIPDSAETDYWSDDDWLITNQPDWANVTGILRLDGVDVVATLDDAFGIDVRVQKISTSNAWDIKI